MANDLNKKKYQRLALPVGKIKVPKFLYIFLIVLIILILVFGGLYFYLKNSIKSGGMSKKNGIVETTNQMTSEPPNLDLSKKTLSWLNTQRDERGAYTTGLECDIDLNCEIPITTNRFGFSVLWAENRYIQKINDEEQLKIFKNDIALYADRNVVKVINNNFWNCYFMWDIWNNSNLDQASKDNLEKICFNSTYESSYGGGIIDIKKMKMVVNDLTSDLITNKAAIDGQLRLNSVEDEDLIEDVNENQYFFNSSDRMARYLWKKNDNDFFNSLIDFQQSLNFYKNKQTEMKAYEGCETGIASLMLFSIWNDSRYLDLSKIILDQQTKKINQNSMKDISICGLLADKLYENTGDKTFKTKKYDIINEFLKNNFDQENSGFYSKSENSKIKNVKYNGIIAGLLIDK